MLVTKSSTTNKPVPATETIDFLTRERQTILGAAETTLTETHLKHYDAADDLEIKRRLEGLLDRLFESLVKQDLSPVVTHAQRIAEDAIWTRLFSALEPDQFAQTLGLVSTILGAGKDALARKYVSLATHTHAPSLDLRALFEGMDGTSAMR